MTSTKQIAALTRQYLKDNNMKIIAYKDVRTINENDLTKETKDYKNGVTARSHYDEQVERISRAKKSLLAQVDNWTDERLNAYKTEVAALQQLKPSEAAEMSALTQVDLTVPEIKKMLRDESTTYTQARMLLDKLEKIDRTEASKIRGAQENLLAKCDLANSQQVAYTNRYMHDKTPMASKTQHLHYTDIVYNSALKDIDAAEAAFDAALAD
jgi:hypothetical protein